MRSSILKLRNQLQRWS